MEKIFIKNDDGDYFLITKMNNFGNIESKTLISKQAYDYLHSHQVVKDIDEYEKELAKQTSNLKKMRNEATQHIPERGRKTKKSNKTKRKGIVTKHNAKDYYRRFLSANKTGKKYFHFEGVKKETDKEVLIVNHLKKMGWL